MSLSFWVATVLVVGGCTAIFKKAVSNDSKNDYRIRDILTHSSEDEVTNSFSARKDYGDRERESVLVGATPNSVEEDMTTGYSTVTHESQTQSYSAPKPEAISQETDYYERINDDACECDDEDDDDYEEDMDNEPKLEREDIKYKNLKEPVYSQTTPKRSLFDYVKTFWRGITFALGMLISIYSFIGITTQVQTSNDAIVYSIWLLIGVILIK